MSFQPFLYGKYIILDRIAVGGMAEVFKAKAYGIRGFERLLVIKRILPHLSSDEEFVEMFIDEAKISVELNHSNICQVTDLGKIDDNFFIAMEFVNGKDLRGILKKSFITSQNLSVPQCLYIVAEVCKGLDYAHRKTNTMTGQDLGIIHRDISPQNIMVSYHGDVKIVDFGIAKTASKMHKTQAGVLKGKFGYMSPEQAEGQELDYRTDIFSVGIILFEILSGQRLFIGETDFETLEKIKNCEIPDLQSINPEISQDIQDILEKALAKHTQDRFESAMSMHQELAKVLYRDYSNFSPKDLSKQMEELFAAEIKEETENLKRSIDSIAQEDLDQLEGLGTIRIQKSSKAFENTPSKQSKVLISPKAALEEDVFIVREDPPSNLFSKLRSIILFCAIAALPLLLWNLFFKTEHVKKKEISETQPPEQQAQNVYYSYDVESSPSGAQIFVDGNVYGTTPTQIELRSDTTYNVKLSKEGYEDLLTQFTASEFENQLYYQLVPLPPEMGTILVQSQPSGASVYQKKQKRNGTTPLELQGLDKDQSYTIEVRKDGYKNRQSSLFLDLDQETISFNMKADHLEFTIQVIPKNAKVFIDGKYSRNKKITDAKDGQKYNILAKADGYETKKSTITVSQSRTSTTIELKKKDAGQGRINVSAIPWAKVIINGKEIGSTPIINQKVPVGTHNIVLQHPDFPDITKKIEVKKDQDQKIIVDMRNGS